MKLTSAPKALAVGDITVTTTATDKDGNVTNLVVSNAKVKDGNVGITCDTTIPATEGDYTITVKAVYQEQELVKKYSITVA